MIPQQLEIILHSLDLSVKKLRDRLIAIYHLLFIKATALLFPHRSVGMIELIRG